MKAKLIILTPVFNDWKNLDKLLTKINKLFHYKIKQKFDLVIVDDNSTEKINFSKSKFRKLNKLKILKNRSNLGSQRSIAIGLKYIKKIYKKNYNLIVIDSDGQDNPLGITKLIEKFNQTNCCVVARRGQRKESKWFKFFYEVYCFLILLLSLKKIRFGNFSLLSFKDVSKILKDNNLWNAFPPTLSLNLDKMSFITIDRDKRYSGISKMNFLGLFNHALRVFSVLRIRMFCFSTMYLILFFLILQNNFFIFFYIFLIIFILMNILNFSIFILSKNKFEKNFKKIKVIKL